ncbi:cytochrome P450 [Phanerochaete sordida]|uniref:Cytochrome P450 n=1 Tax=Phanerochaete sordida TaxID=48140 RepID=A0A9P3G9D3_9APHY|nr:cytochrome P450 [Phanerochaete sordida]
MKTIPDSFGILLAFVAIATIYLRHRSRASKLSFPPGPWEVPLFGNIFNLDLSCPWDLFTRWKSDYGNLVGLNILGTRVIILNSHESIVDLLEKRGNIYSHRPTFTVLGELMNLNKSIMLIPYGPEWKECRRLEHLALSTAAVKHYEPMQERVAATLCMDLIEDAANFYNLVRLNSARVVLHIIYGISPRVIDREYITHAEETMRIVGESSVLGTYLCDFIPIMKHLPHWVPFQRKAAEGRMKIERMVTTPFSRVKQEMDAGTASPSLLYDLLTGMKAEELTVETEERIMWTTASMYAAGAESTAGTTNVFLIAMALHPEAQAKAHEEIDKVVGTIRLPRLSDRDELPYINALVKEVMRWHPILPLGISRRTAADDVYGGYFIPKDTVIVPNVWQIAFSPNERYPPDDFIPERFLDNEVPTTDPSLWAFGFGRRLCPGKALGETNIWILIATLLAVFDVSPPEEDVLDPQYEPQLVSLPKRFACRIVPRSPEKVRLVQEALL